MINGVAGFSFDDFENHQIDLFGDAYEFLISKYAANTGKSGGEFFPLRMSLNSLRNWYCWDQLQQEPQKLYISF